MFKEKGKNLTLGLSIKPNTLLDEIVKYENKFSKLLIMTVEPGAGGQKYIESMNEKISVARKLFSNYTIQIDGGVKMETIEEPLRLGVNSFVMGTYLVMLDKDELYNRIVSLSIKKDIEELPKKVNIEFEKRILQIVPDGYAEGDEMIGVNVPDIRRLCKKWYKYINYDILDYYITSNYHEYRRFAVYTLSNIVKDCKNKLLKGISREENIEKIRTVNEYIEKNIKYINNWDFTDEVGPNITARYLECFSSEDEIKEKLEEFLSSDNIWKKRIGIVSMLNFAKKGDDKLVFWVTDKVLYEEFHLFQKATGWVLRELYKVKSRIVINYLKQNNEQRRIPSILMTYACEKMTKREKDRVRLIK